MDAAPGGPDGHAPDRPQDLRWSPKKAVRKDDQFTAAPDFIDRHESRHLPLWGRLGASWHGLTGPRQVVVATSSIAALGVAAALAILAFAGLAGPSASDPPAGGRLEAQQASGPLESEQPVSDPLDGVLNSTAPAPPPSLGPSPGGPGRTI